MEQQVSDFEDINFEKPVFENPESTKNEGTIQYFINALHEKFNKVIEFLENLTIA